MGIPNKRYKMASQLDPREKAIIVTDYLLPLKRKMIHLGIRNKSALATGLRLSLEEKSWVRMPLLWRNTIRSRI